jgi:tetratricopeptide (TPR) repeat protein
MRIARLGVAVALLALPLNMILAQEHAHPTGEKLGTVHFPTSCAPAVAPKFDRGVALLHSFEFGEAIRAFNEVISSDSTCAMAHWGVALSRWSNPMAAGLRSATLLQQGKLAIDAATRHATRATERERGYIAAVAKLYEDPATRDQRARIIAYEKAMEEVSARNPGDTEAKVFYAISLVATAPPGDKTYANQLKAGAILEALWAKQPEHPGYAHYIIHAYDVPALAGKAQAAAARYAGIAPSAAHAQHMPSHTFTRVGMWKESIDANLMSRSVAMKAGALGEALHALDYAMYAYLQLGNETAAKALLDSVPALAAKYDPTFIGGAAPPSAAYFAIAAIPARWVLERRSWPEAAALTPTSTAFPYTEAMTHFARALGASRTGDLARARTSVDSLDSIQKRLAASGETYWAEQVAIQKTGASAWVALAEKRNDEALRLMREAVAREDATEKNAVTPGPLAPARELLGDMLLALGKAAEARVEYQAVLKKEPNRRHSMRGAGAK